jgi:hypothetical protein
MIRYLGGLLVVVLVGIPLLRAPSELVGALGAIAGMLCAGGLITLSIPLLTAGASVALAEYALALVWIASAPLDFVGAIGLGVALWLLFEVTAFAQRVRGVAVAPEVFREQARSWIATGVAIALLSGVVTIATSVVGLRLPASVYPAAVALGALGVFVGVVRALLRASSRPAPASTGEKR